jgi:ABC-type multidrug transport system fused ATPase/permease subunit
MQRFLMFLVFAVITMIHPIAIGRTLRAQKVAQDVQESKEETQQDVEEKLRQQELKHIHDELRTTQHAVDQFAFFARGG